MNELSNVLHEVLKALGIEGAEGVGPHRGPEPGEPHPRPAAAPAVGA